MKIIQKLIFINLLFVHLYCAIGGYNTIYIMEFENINSDFSINSFRTAFPDLIIDNYSFRSDIHIRYADNSLTYDESMDSKRKSLIVNGRFETDEKRIDVDIELYDLKTWDSLGKKSFYCSKQDFVCIHDAFIITVEELISPYLIEDAIDEITYVDSKVDDKPSFIFEITAEEEKLIEKEYIETVEGKSVSQGFDVKFDLSDVEYSKEFNFSNNTNNSTPLIDMNSEKMVHILSQFLTNPYSVEIGDMDITVNENDVDLIDINVPITFSVKKSLIDELLSDLPKQEVGNSDNFLMFKFSNHDFRFERDLVEQLALMKYQLMPTVNFVDRKGNLQLLILDSWKRKYNKLTIGGTKFIQRTNFSPLYSIKPGRDNLQISVDLNPIQISYSFSVRYNTFGDYTKMIVKFMLESELDQYLSVSSHN